MNATQIQTAFKNFGKLVKLASTSQSFANSVKSCLMALNDQMTDSTLDTYDIFQTVVMPTETSVGRIVTSAESITARMRTAVENYLVILAADLPVGPGATAVDQLTSLAQAMTTASQSVEPDGVFFAFFNDGWGVALPTNVSPTCPDTWITETLIP